MFWWYERQLPKYVSQFVRNSRLRSTDTRNRRWWRRYDRLRQKVKKVIERIAASSHPRAVTTLAPYLVFPYTTFFADILQAFRGLGSREAVCPLLLAIGHFDHDKQAEVLAALSYLDPNWREGSEARATLPLLINALTPGPMWASHIPPFWPYDEQIRVGDYERVCLAAKALAHLNDPGAVDDLVRAFDRLMADVVIYPWHVYADVLNALISIRDARAIGPLVRALESPRVTEPRLLVIETLGQIGDSVAISALHRLITSKTSEVEGTHGRLTTWVEGALDALVMLLKRLGPCVSDDLLTALAALDESYRSGDQPIMGTFRCTASDRGLWGDYDDTYEGIAGWEPHYVSARHVIDLARKELMRRKPFGSSRNDLDSKLLVACPCGVQLKTTYRNLGKVARCPHCGRAMVLSICHSHADVAEDDN
jgi:hypothetical protein